MDTIAKSDQHYLPQMYLKAWNNPNIFWLYKRKIEQRNVKSIAYERCFYEFKPLTSIEIEYILTKYIYRIDDPSLRVLAFREFYFDIETSIEVSFFNKQLDRLSVNKQKPNSKLNANYTKAMHAFCVNYRENCFAEMENEFEQNILSNLRKGDNKVLEYIEKRMVLLRYIWQQFFRTKRTREGMKVAHESIFRDLSAKKSCYANMEIENVHNSIIEIDAFLYSYNDSHDNNDNCYLLKNNTNLPFITGDQPVINMSYNCIKTERNDLYFPISPQYAIIKSDLPITNFIKDYNDLSREEVEELNNKINEWKLSQLFSSDINSLMPYIN